MIEVGQDLRKAIQLLEANELVAIPTETVYGLAGNALNDLAIRKIFRMKSRPLFNPLIVHIHALDQMLRYCRSIPSNAFVLAEAFWPGPLTLLLDKNSLIPDIVTAGSAKVALRMPNHSLTISLLQQLSFPLVAPSANPFKSISPTKAEHVVSYFANELEYVLDGGECQFGIESTIIGFEENKGVIYRLGSLTVEEIEQVIGPCILFDKPKEAPLAPGMLSTHYSPRTSLILSTDIHLSVKLNQHKKIGLLLFDQFVNEDVIIQELLSSQSDLKEAASNLFASLHKLDALNLDLIIAQYFPNHDQGRALNDRLKRASI